MTLGDSELQMKEIVDEFTRLGLSSRVIGYILDRCRQGGVMSDREIREGLESGSICISPLDPMNIANSSVDVRLGRYYYKERSPGDHLNIYNPYDERHVRGVWGDPGENQRAINAGEWMMKNGVQLENIRPDEEIIWINPGETILAHTMEFIGGADGFLTTMMKARSSLGRNFIGVCKCAGWGDIGYHNRWTMEITNFSTHYKIPLVVGRRLAQIVFFRTGGSDRPYHMGGKYQQLATADYDEMDRLWKPWAMLPQMYKDREISVAVARR